MTRSNDPFEDLPEWKERKQLQEAQRARHEAGAETGYANGAGYAAPYDNQAGYGNGYSEAPDYGDQQGWADPAAQGYGQGGGPGHQDYVAQPPYDAQAYHQGGAGYDGQADAWQREDAGYSQPGFGGSYAPPQGGDPRLRGGHYEEPVFGYPPLAEAQPSLDDYRPSGAGEATYGAPPPFFSGQSRADDTFGAQGYRDDVDGAEEDYDEYEYEDDDEEEGGRFSWKLLAGVIVAGAVVSIGGFTLYDTLAGGGSSGPAPIIKADRGPAKTAPADPGGKTFANQDSKLLGRLDSGRGGQRTAALDEDGRNRVREVPTVRVSPDGRLILPKAPEAVGNGDSGSDPGTGASSSIPGINIVDSLNGNGGSSSLGGLPPVIPQSATPSTRTAATSVAQPRALNAQTSSAVSSSPSQPIIRNGSSAGSGGGSGANLATASGGTPPVPQKSAIASAWRMSSPQTRTAAATPQPTNTAATTTASTLGAASVARASRQYVAVVATKSSRMEALSSFAELQQRHPQALANRVPSVQKADLSSRGLGTMYRLLVGPAGSRQAANEVCASLKAGGYSGCWVKSN